jgi:hypothetical protein
MSSKAESAKGKEYLVSNTARDIVDDVWAKAKAFGRREFALEIELLVEKRDGHRYMGDVFLTEIKGAIERELRKADSTPQSEIANPKS